MFHGSIRFLVPLLAGAMLALPCLSQAAPVRPQVDANGAHAVSEEAQVYRTAKSGVVTVETDFGHGTGFVFDKRGLVLTNQHVTNGTDWIALRFGRGLRVPASVVCEDKEADVAVVCFNPEAVKTFSVLDLADAHSGVLAVEGERVLAIGNPLHQDTVLTTGIVSKLENGVIISNVNINHGSSGGPLLNLSGKVIGITTFGDFTAQGGPGISGIVAIGKAERAMAEANTKISSMTLPSSGLLPDISMVPVPPAALTEAAERSIKPETMKVAGFEGEIITPFVLASQRGELEREAAKKKGRRPSTGRGVDPSRFWEQYVGTVDQPVVTVMVSPQIGETSGSKRRGFWGAFGGGLLGVAIITKKSFEFKSEFAAMQLYRGDTLVEPVRRSRVAYEISVDNSAVKMKDKSYRGVYQYDPSAFDPSQPLQIRVFKASDPSKYSVVKLDKKVQQRIWDEFAAYRAACDSASPSVSSGAP
ncbi:MAG TPA: trypsin-like peptidase domain-containing protein [Chthonomonadaceae bacterium]|nr:trypsin-like peptidase domain-containing protein [Chthonomonadaceae bacterium]